MPIPDFLQTPIGKRIVHEADRYGIKRDQAYQKIKRRDQAERDVRIKSINMIK